jgi:uncharacterized protein
MSMELDHSFTVPVPPEQAWDVLLDVNRIAPCMPGATVDEFDGEVVTGRIRVKVGPVSLTYRGTAKFTERDPDTGVVVVEASGKETRGAGTASANIRATLTPEGSADGTKVDIHTSMNVTGRPAQFGRGVIAEVGGKLVEQFANNLSQLIAGGGGAGQAAESTAAQTAAAQTAAPQTAGAAGGEGSAEGGTAPAAASTAASAVAEQTGPGSTQPVPVRHTTATPPPAAASDDSINLIRLVGPAILKRVAPVAVAAVLAVLLGWQLRHALRRRRSGQA